MRIAVSSQNFRTITSHAGKSRRFLIYDVVADADAEAGVVEVERLDLPPQMSLHDYHGDDHPLFERGIDVIVTGGAGAGFMNRVGRRGIRVVATAETNIPAALSAIANDRPLPAAAPHEHDHADEPSVGSGQGHGHGHGHGHHH